MVEKLSDLRAQMSTDGKAQAHEPAENAIAQMPLRELRQARQLTQEALARTLGSNQALVSKLERRNDMYLSSLRSYVEAVGGRLDIVAHFPDGNVRISQFDGIDAV